MLNAILDRSDRCYAPGETLLARIEWDLDSPPRAIYLELRWDTEGKGTSDYEVVSEEKWTGLSARGNQTWSVRLPRGPLSLDGRLLRIHWSLRCRADGRDINPVSLTISPTRQPIQLSTSSESRSAP
jgi:hypothetical protein